MLEPQSLRLLRLCFLCWPLLERALGCEEEAVTPVLLEAPALRHSSIAAESTTSLDLVRCSVTGSAGFEPGFEPRLAHYPKCYTYTWFLLGFAAAIILKNEKRSKCA